MKERQIEWKRKKKREARIEECVDVASLLFGWVGGLR